MSQEICRFCGWPKSAHDFQDTPDSATREKMIAAIPESATKKSGFASTLIRCPGYTQQRTRSTRRDDEPPEDKEEYPRPELERGKLPPDLPQLSTKADWRGRTRSRI